MTRKAIELGQQYQQADNPRAQWEVEHVYNDGHGVPHARLRSLKCRVDERTYSCSVILDARHFLPLAGVAHSG
jgi:hypothetical protein